MKRLFVTTALAAALAAGPAFAAQDDTAEREKAPDAAQQQQMNEPKSAPDQAAAANTGSIEFVSSQKESDWLATSIIGRSVRNGEGDTLGDITEILLDQEGDVVAVLIGVGGFLGLGGKDVAVNYDSLEFKKREIRQQPPARDMREDAYRRTTNTPGPPGGVSRNPMLDPQRQSAAVPRKDAYHSDKVIVLNATREQLESAPAFRRIGEAETSEQGESEPAGKADRMEQEKPAGQ